MGRKWLTIVFLAAGILLAACQARLAAPLLGITPQEAAVSQVSPRRATGSLGLNIRWPERWAQYIPPETVAIEFKIYAANQPTPFVTRSVPRPVGGGVSPVRFDDLPTGDLQIQGTAKNGKGEAVASGVAQVKILPNQLVSGALHLDSTELFKIISLSAWSADPTSTVTIMGVGFGASRNATFSVQVGDLTVPEADLRREDDTTMSFKVPEGATNSVVVLKVGTRFAESHRVFTTIHAWELSPATADVFVPYGLQTFSAEAEDFAGRTIVDPPYTWTVEAIAGPAARIEPALDDDDDEVEGDDIMGRFVAGVSDGTYKVRIGNGSAAREATVTTHPLTFADVKDVLAPLDSEVSHPPDNPATPAKIALGRALFFDPRLGSNGAMACATCHLPEQGWGDGLARSMGNDGAPLPRNAPTILNVALQPGAFFWDGRAATLEAQAKAVFASPLELNRSGESLKSVLETAGYPASFSTIFGAPPSTGPEALDMTAKAIAAFERTVVTDEAQFDRWARGDQAALSPVQKRGLAIFVTRGRCAACHSGPLFSDGKFHNIAIMDAEGSLGPGRQAVTGRPEDLGAFKTPTLRNVAETAPYFHIGSAQTLEDAILHYESNLEDFTNIDPEVEEPIFLPGTDRADLVQFLKALSGPDPHR
ncbi:hypothetical protein J7643_01005 [bacterium]|nr:hypothetical protein [bacterium]